MRQRSLASIVTGSLVETCIDDRSDSEQSIIDFQAEQTEKSATVMLSVMRIVLALWLPMFTVHVLTNRLSAQGVIQALPRLLIWSLLCGHRQYLKKKMKHYPIVVATGVQCIGHLTVTYGMVATSFHMPEGLVQHRVFLTQFLPMYLLAAANLYMPMNVYLIFVGPLYMITWIVFHASVGFLTVSSAVYALCISAFGLYVRRYQTGILWHEFQAAREVQEERNVSKAMQESFRGILSTIFDASCTCDKSGQLRESSPQLQELLGFTNLKVCEAKASTTHEMACSVNLCTYAATDAEAARVESFLASAFSGGRSQASKIQCSLRRRGSYSTDVIDMNLLAIALEDFTHDQSQAGLLFVVFEKLTPEVIQQDAVFSTFSSVMSRGLESSSHQQSSHQVQKEHALPEELGLSDGISDCVKSAFGTIEDSLIYSISDCVKSTNQPHAAIAWDTETQTTIIPLVSVGVQTISTAGKPPLPALDMHLQTPIHARALGGRLQRNRGRVFTKKRGKLLPSYAATPQNVIHEAVFINLLLSINPVCVRGCCMYHTLLNFLRQELTSMLKADPCKSWETEDKNQCAVCFFLQDKEDDEDQFECCYCSGGQICRRGDSDMSSTSSSRNVSS